jgi:hypothetical protein
MNPDLVSAPGLQTELHQVEMVESLQDFPMRLGFSPLSRPGGHFFPMRWMSPNAGLNLPFFTQLAEDNPDIPPLGSMLFELLG